MPVVSEKYSVIGLFFLVAFICFGFTTVACGYDSHNIEVEGQLGGSTVTACWNGHYLYFGIGPRIGILDATDTNSTVIAGFTRPLDGMVTGLVVRDNFLFASSGETGLVILNISDPLKPEIITSVKEDFTFAKGVALDGNNAFVAAGKNGVLIYDVTAPASPVKVGSIKTDGEVISVSAQNGMLFLAEGTGGVRLIDISNPASPRQISSFRTPGQAWHSAPYGNYLYVADWTAGLRIVDISAPDEPRTVAVLDTDGYSRWVDLDFPYAFLADGPGGIRIVDISSTASPVLLETIPATTDRVPANVTCVATNAGLAAVARGDMGLSIFDVSRPESPGEIFSYSVPGFPQDLAVNGDMLYLACDSQGMWSVDISSPSNPVEINNSLPDSGNLAVALMNNYAVLSNGYSGISILDLSSGPLFPEIGAMDTAGFAWDAAVNGTFVYVADGDNGLRIIDASDPHDPVETGFVLTPQSALNVEVLGNYAYIAAVDGGLIIVDVSDARNPRIVSSFKTDGPALDVTVAGTVAYVSAGGEGLEIIDISKPLNPVKTGQFKLDGAFTFSADVNGTLACVANGEKGISVVDVSVPAKPTEIAYFNSPGNAWRVRWNDGKILLADEGGGVYVLKITENLAPPAPQLKLTVQDSGPELTWSSGATSNSLLRYGCDSMEVKVLNDPSSPDTFFVDAEELSDFAYLYWVHLNYGDGQEEDSYRVGIVPSTHLGNFQAQNFSISSNRLDVATLTWEPIADSSTKLIMWILRLDGRPPETVQMEPGADSFSDITGGVAACYSLLGLNNFSLSRTDFICLFP